METKKRIGRVGTDADDRQEKSGHHLRKKNQWEGRASEEGGEEVNRLGALHLAVFGPAANEGPESGGPVDGEVLSLWGRASIAPGYTPCTVSGRCPVPVVDASFVSFTPPPVAGFTHYTASPLQTKPAAQPLAALLPYRCGVLRVLCWAFVWLRRRTEGGLNCEDKEVGNHHPAGDTSYQGDYSGSVPKPLA